MSQKCKCCSHPRAKEIDQALAAKQSYLAISSSFAVSRNSVRNHALNHLRPLIDAANTKAQAAVVTSIVRYRKEVNFPPLQKAKWMQDKIANRLDALPDTIPNIPSAILLMRELRGWFDIENKLAGNYIKDRESVQTIDKVVAAFNDFVEHTPPTTPEEKAEWVLIFARGGNVPVEELANRVGVSIE